LSPLDEGGNRSLKLTKREGGVRGKIKTGEGKSISEEGEARP
jgi:hypothetical protein